MIVAEAPGKLFVNGEYAVVEPGRHAIIVGVSKFIRATLRPAVPAEGSTVSSPHFGSQPVPVLIEGDLVSIEAPGAELVRECIRVVVQLARERAIDIAPFALEIESELDDESGRKFGLGSSGAVAVVTVRALAQHLGLDVDDEAVYRLASLATIELRPAASCADIATSTLGGWVHYASPDRLAVRELRRTRGVAASLSDAWPGLVLEALPDPSSTVLHVGWTSAPASTAELVGTLHAGDWRSSAEYARFLEESDRITAALVVAVRSDTVDHALTAIRDAEANLEALDELSGIGIRTKALKALIAAARSVGIPAKTSGAGGGDCGIALAPARNEALDAAWRAAGIEVLNLHVVPHSRVGVREHG
ncbi:phosphomevalonate kinase [Pseudoclavibacter sp. AY1F1]|uniref:phosphomevalonate kinase n=1 Tax=Pseudoclavibacter sp. AY1F1 TaxID=2080583 RepID=UPI000CE8F4A5|nr:phosphomevalonate kinase [Pseudoclavibacter sp. AY1F1]PPF44194.1 phosphomevalonate kinase [Pseudoclavibacter sp. AY1F1]